MKIPLYKKLARALIARNSCQRDGNKEWLDKWNQTIDNIMKSAPSGAGFDHGIQWTSLSTDYSGDNKLIFITNFHHMNENGYYDDWSCHEIEVTPDLGYELGINVSGSNKNEIKDYIADVFIEWLTQEVEEFDNYEQSETINQQANELDSKRLELELGLMSLVPGSKSPQQALERLTAMRKRIGTVPWIKNLSENVNGN